MQVVGIVVVVVLVIGFLLVLAGVKIVQEYERGVIFRLGRCVGAKGPGMFFVVPFIDKIVRTNLQEIAVPVQPQQVITKDNVTLQLDAVAFLRVMDPVSSVIKVQNWYQASSLIAQTALRSVIGHHDLDELLSSRDVIDAELRLALDAQTEEWGVEVRRVELRDLDLPEQIQRAMGRQAEAERERRAKIISADGELQASERIAEAARFMATSGAMQLRTLQTMAEISTERNSTIIFPIPTEIMDAFRSYTAAQDRLHPGEDSSGALPPTPPAGPDDSPPPPVSELPPPVEPEDIPPVSAPPAPPPPPLPPIPPSPG